MNIAKTHELAQIYSFTNIDLAQSMRADIDQMVLEWRPANRYTDKTTLPNWVGICRNNQLLEQAKTWFDRCLNQVARRDMGAEYRLALSDLWLTRTEQGGSTHRHNHPLSVYSGIFYLEHSEQGTHFELPLWYYQHWPLMFEHRSPPRSQTWQQSCTQGTLVIFPSYVYHWVDVQKTAEPRYTMAWNSFWHGTINHNLGTRLSVLTQTPR